MPLQDHKLVTKRIFKVGDTAILHLPKFVKDANDPIVYPQEIVKKFIRYFNRLYQERIAHAENFVVDVKPSENNPGKSHLMMFVYVPGELTRDDFIDDLHDFEEEVPGIKCEIDKKHPKEKKQSRQGLQMAKNTNASYPQRKSFKGLKKEELELAEKLFEQEYGRKFDKTNEEDKENIVLLFNERQEEDKNWYPATVRIDIPVGQFAPDKEGDVDLLSLYDDGKKVKKVKDSNFTNKSMTLADIKNAPIGWYFEDSSIEMCKVGKNALYISEGSMTIDEYIQGMVDSTKPENLYKPEDIITPNTTFEELNGIGSNVYMKFKILDVNNREFKRMKKEYEMETGKSINDNKVNKDSNKFQEIKEEQEMETIKNKVKDEENDLLKLAKLLGEAHDKIMEALDLAEGLENNNQISSDLRYEIEDVEASTSALDYMGNEDPVKVMLEEYPADFDEDELEMIKEEPDYDDEEE